VFQGQWHSTRVACKFVPSRELDQLSASYREALLSKQLSHPNVVQCYVARCAQMSEAFIMTHLCGPTPARTSPQLRCLINQHMCSDYVSGEGFGDPRKDMGYSLEGEVTWKEIIAATGVRPGDYMTVVIMDFCNRGSLATPISKGIFQPNPAWTARVGQRALLRTAREIAQGLSHLHALDVVHGDLKPGNVLLKASRADRRGFTAQVTDFGLSQVLEGESAVKGNVRGTIPYLSPEMLDGTMSKPADIYAFGIMLWEMITGQKPYRGMLQAQVVVGVRLGHLRPAWPTSLFAELEPLYMRCIAQDPDARPTATQVVQELLKIEIKIRDALRTEKKAQQQAAQKAAAQAGEAVALAAAPRAEIEELQHSGDRQG